MTKITIELDLDLDNVTDGKSLDNLNKVITNKLAEVDKQIGEAMSLVGTKIFKLAFDNVPALKAIAWNQYTPYFNDGDECVFCVNDPAFIREIDEEDFEQLLDGEYYENLESVRTIYNGWRIENLLTKPTDELTDWDRKYIEDYRSATAEQHAILSALENWMTGSGQDSLKRTYGDHSSIVIYRNEDGELETVRNEYDHE